jgi:hypothetical protein
VESQLALAVTWSLWLVESQLALAVTWSRLLVQSLEALAAPVSPKLSLVAPIQPLSQDCRKAVTSHKTESLLTAWLSVAVRACGFVYLGRESFVFLFYRLLADLIVGE